MFRVYSQEFYDNKSLKEEFENRYISCLVKKAKNAFVKENISDTESCSLYDFCNTKLQTLLIKYPQHNLPNSFEKLLILPPKEIAKIYCEFSQNIDFQTDVIDNFSQIWRKGKKIKGKEFYKRDLLDYDFFSDTIAKHIIDNEKEELYTIRTCVYCNRAYINSYEVSKEIKKRQFDLDHFIPKKKCPLFALSLYNLVPSCQVCNSRIKNSKLYYEDIKNPSILEKLFPTSEKYNYDKSLKFRIIPCKKIYEKFQKEFTEFKEMPDYFEIEFEKLNSDSQYYEKESEKENGFDILNRYNFHKKEFLSYIDKARKYPLSYFLMWASNTSLSDANDLREAIFNSKFRNEEKMIFQKIYNDIDSEL